MRPQAGPRKGLEPRSTAHGRYFALPKTSPTCCLINLPILHLFHVIYLLQHLQKFPTAYSVCVLCLAAQLCPTLWDLTDCSPPGSSVHGDSPAKNAGVGYHALLQGIFPTQGLNPGLPHCILYHLSHQGNPRLHIYTQYGECSF